MLKREEIRIRDPFVMPDREAGVYYLYGTTALKEGLNAGNTFSAYKTRDLENFEGPYTVFDGGKTGFWADRKYISTKAGTISWEASRRKESAARRRSSLRTILWGRFLR